MRQKTAKVCSLQCQY